MDAKSTQITQVGEVVRTSSTGSVLGSDAYLKDASERGVPYVRVGDLKELEVTETGKWVAAHRRDATYVEKGAVLFAEQPVPGQVSVAGRKVAIHSDIRALECRSEVEPMFLACSLMARQHEIQKFAKGRTIPRISKQELWSLKVRVPSVDDQKHVVETAKRYRTLKRSRQRSVSLAQAYPRSCFQQLVSHARSRGVVSKVLIKDLLDGMKGGSPINSTDETSTNTEYALAVGTEEVTGSGYILREKCETVRLNSQSVSEERLRANELVIVARGNLTGKAARAPEDGTAKPMVPNSSLIRLKVNTENVDPTYLVHSIMTDRVQSLISRYKSQFSPPRIPQRDLKEVKVTMVPKSLQLEFAQRLKELYPLLRRQHQSIHLIEELEHSILDRFR